MHERKENVIGIVGCGLIADTHIEAILVAVPDARIAVCDPLAGKAQLLRNKYGLHSSYTNITEMLNCEGPSSVHILSPPHLHVAHARQCLEAGCHVLVEKPLCFSRDEAEELFDLGRRQGKVLCVDHSLLFQPSVLKMIEFLRTTPGMNVLHVNSFYGLDNADAGSNALMQDWKRKMIGGFMMDSLIHPVTLGVALSGTPSRIQANFIKKNDDITELLISWQALQTIVSITVSAGSHPFRRMTEVTTSAGTFTIDHSTEVLVFAGVGLGPRALKKIAKNLGFASRLTFGTIRTAFDVLRGRIKQNPGARALIGAYYRHLASNENIPVPEKNVLDSVLALETVAAIINKNYGSKRTSNLSPAHSEGSPPLINTLVTGASGFLGRFICNELISSGKRKVIALVRRGPNADRLPASPFLEKRFVDLETMMPEDYQSLLNGIDEVIHCAHASRVRTWDKFYRTNVESTCALYKAAAIQKCKRFIHVSSVAVYGLHKRQSNIIGEESPVQTKKGGWDFYVRSKSQADLCLTDLARKGDTPLVILRPGILYAGSGERLSSRSVMLGNQRVIVELGRGINRLPYTRVEVLAKKIRELLEMSPFPAGIYNVTGPCDEAQRQFKSRRLKALGIKARFISIPVSPLKILAVLMEALWHLMLSKRPPRLTRYVLDSATRDLRYDCSKAAQAFHWNPIEAVALPERYE